LAGPSRRPELRRRFGFTVFAAAERFRYETHTLKAGGKGRFALTAQTDSGQRCKAARFLGWLHG
jgi:hypothetical protein